MFNTVKMQLDVELYHVFHSSSIQYISTANIFVMENIVSLYTSKCCTTCARKVQKLIHSDQIVFQSHRSRQGSPGMCWKCYITVLMCPSCFIYEQKYQQTHKIMGYFHTNKLSESENRDGSVTLV